MSDILFYKKFRTLLTFVDYFFKYRTNENTYSKGMNSEYLKK